MIELRRYLRLVTIIGVLLLGYVTWLSYEGHVSLVDSQRAACGRGKLDRRANAEGWRAAEAARRATGTHTDLVAAGKYARIAGGLERRAGVDCVVAFPSPSLLPF